MDHPELPCARGSRGFTLAELLVTLGIAATLLGIAAPPLGRLVDSVHLSTASNAFMSSLRLARSEALKRASRVAMCKSADGATCAAAGGWEQGWILFHDPNGNGTPDGGEALIQRTEALGGSLAASGNQLVARTISFVATGGPRVMAGGLQAGTVTFCRRSFEPGPARRIVIGTGGRARVVQDSVPACE